MRCIENGTVNLWRARRDQACDQAGRGSRNARRKAGSPAQQQPKGHGREQRKWTTRPQTSQATAPEVPLRLELEQTRHRKRQQTYDGSRQSPWRDPVLAAWRHLMHKRINQQSGARAQGAEDCDGLSRTHCRDPGRAQTIYARGDDQDEDHGESRKKVARRRKRANRPQSGCERILVGEGSPAQARPPGSKDSVLA